MTKRLVEERIGGERPADYKGLAQLWLLLAASADDLSLVSMRTKKKKKQRKSDVAERRSLKLSSKPKVTLMDESPS